MMTADERIKLYLSGETDRETGVKLENQLLEDDLLLERFIEVCEQNPVPAPDGLAGAAMSAVLKPVAADVPLPGLRLRAAMCFCGAAAVIVFTLFGSDGLADVLDLPQRFQEFWDSILASRM